MEFDDEINRMSQEELRAKLKRALQRNGFLSQRFESLSEEVRDLRRWEEIAKDTKKELDISEKNLRDLQATHMKCPIPLSEESFTEEDRKPMTGYFIGVPAKLAWAFRQMIMLNPHCRDLNTKLKMEVGDKPTFFDILPPQKHKSFFNDAYNNVMKERSDMKSVSDIPYQQNGFRTVNEMMDGGISQDPVGFLNHDKRIRELEKTQGLQEGKINKNQMINKKRMEDQLREINILSQRMDTLRNQMELINGNKGK